MIECVGSNAVLRAALAILMLGFLGPGRCETLVASDLHTRLVVAFKVPETPLQRWLPEGWQLNPPNAGPNRGANLILGFVDRLLNLDPAGKPIGGGRDRYLAIVVPAKQANGSQTGNMVIRVYTGNAQLLPGAYKTSVQAEVAREHSDRGNGVEPGAASDAWEVSDSSGGLLHFRVQYRRGTLARSTTEAKFFSPIQPDFFRIYRTQQGLDVVKSIPLEVDRIENVEFTVTLTELTAMFDGTEQLLSISESPWSMRDIFLPN